MLTGKTYMNDKLTPNKTTMKDDQAVAKDDKKGNLKNQAGDKQKPKVKISEPTPTAEEKPNGLLGGLGETIQRCMRNTREEINKAYAMVKQKVEGLQRQWFQDEDQSSAYDQPAVTKGGVTATNDHKKYTPDVTKALNEGDFQKIAAALARNYSGKYFETKLALSAAADGYKLHNVEWALDQLHKHGMTSQAITKIREDTAIKRLKKDLSSAMSSKNLNTLDCFTWEAYSDRARKELGTQLTDAIALRNRLNRLRCIRAAVLQTDDTALFEIFSNNNPSPALQATIAAMYLLLGKPPRDLNNWSTSQKLLKNKDPKKKLKTLVSKFSGDVSADVRRRAQKLVDAHDHMSVAESSKHALVFYIWVQAMLKEMETQNAVTLSRVFANM